MDTTLFVIPGPEPGIRLFASGPGSATMRCLAGCWETPCWRGPRMARRGSSAQAL